MVTLARHSGIDALWPTDFVLLGGKLSLCPINDALGLRSLPPVVLLRGWLKLCGELLRTCHLPPCQAKTVPRRIPWPIDPLLQMMPPPRPRARIEAPEKKGSGGPLTARDPAVRPGVPAGLVAGSVQPGTSSQSTGGDQRTSGHGSGGWVLGGLADPRGDPRAATRIRSVAASVGFSMLRSTRSTWQNNYIGSISRFPTGAFTDLFGDK
jgi:hypothetical protein